MRLLLFEDEIIAFSVVKTDDDLNCSLFFLLLPTDKMKDGIIAKLANQAADYYGDAYKQCQYKDTLPKVSNSWK